MSDSSFELIPATSRSWSGMKRVLFQPFSIGKWFVLGFSAWLAHLLESGSGNVQSSYGSETTDDTVDQTAQSSQATEEWERGKEWVQAHWEWVIGGTVLAVILLLAIVVTLVWVRSRGKLMFLDNVIEELVGDIQDEFDNESSAFSQINEKEFVVEGAMTLNELSDHEPILDLESGEVTTVGGYITRELGYIPEPGETLEIMGYEARVTNTDGRRVGQVHFRKLDPETSEDEAS